MTQREIAEKLNISPATLSLVLNNKPGISPSLRQRVINDLTSSGHGNLLRKAESIPSKNIAFIVFKRNGNILDQSPFFSLITENMCVYAQSLGYNMMLTFFDIREDVPHQTELLRSLSCIGAIVFATEMLNEDLSYFSQLPYPCIFMDNFFENCKADSVAVDNSMGTFQAIEYLAQLGHKKIGYLKSQDSISSFQERDYGYASACRKFNMELNCSWNFELPFFTEAAERQLYELLKSADSLPTAFVSDDDIIAAGAIHALEAAGFSVPEDISVIGFSNRPLGEHINPSLTTIDIKAGFGIATIRQLISMIENLSFQEEPITMKTRIGTTLVIRDSAAPPKSECRQADHA